MTLIEFKRALIELNMNGSLAMEDMDDYWMSKLYEKFLKGESLQTILESCYADADQK